MDKVQAHALVKNTLEFSFAKTKFTNLVKNLLNEVNESKAFHARGYVAEIFRGYVKTYERIGTYTDPDKKKIDVLIVYLQRETSIERARTAQRNFAARYLKDRGEKDAGLIAFVSPNFEDWRFSFVKMEYRFEETEKGKIKVKEEFTPAKRYSFLVGANENSHTAQSRLVPLLLKPDEQNPKLDEIEELFSVEKATKEFFDKYRELYLRTHDTLEIMIAGDKVLRADFQEKNVSIVDFCKKLLGQIVFLYFLQRKGWFGVTLHKSWGEGDKKFLRSLFEHAKSEKKNYFNDYLEPLFYEALARERSDDYYSRFDCRIPFLNGGLFDPINNYDWVNTVINFPDDLFSNETTTKEGDKGNGILDVFDRFNFTVKEDEPLEKEVAVDPEMLGKVFENLLEVKDRKSKGTYYTPREIVHYMCQQSLINYLVTALSPSPPAGDGRGEGVVIARNEATKQSPAEVCHSRAVPAGRQEGGNPVPTKEDIELLIKHGESVGENEARVERKGEETDTYYYKLPENIREHAKLIDDKLADIKVCDPAIGSGAFPVGMMTEIVKTRNVLTSYISPSPLMGKGRGEGEKRTNYNLKRHCIHNSLYGVDIDPGAIEIAKLRLWLSLIVDEEDIKQIKPLPNLDYKIMQGNSLLEEYEGIKLFDDKLIAGINETESRIKEIKDKISQLENELLELHRQDKLTRQKEKELKETASHLSKILKKIISSQDNKESNADFIKDASVRKQKADKLKQLHETFFDSIHKREKDALKKEIETLEWELIEATLKEQGKTSELDKLEEFKKSNTKPFFLWKLNFSEVFQDKGGFDVVIANPPYVKEDINRHAFDGLRDSPYYQGKMDLWYYFGCKGMDLVRGKGIICFIAINNWISNDGASVFRNKTINEGRIIEFIDFGNYKVFAAGVQTMVFLILKDNKTAIYDLRYGKLLNDSLNEDIVSYFLNYDRDISNLQFIKYSMSFDKDIFRDNYINFAPLEVGLILNKIRQYGAFHLNDDEIFSGIDVMQDFVNKKHLETLGSNCKIGDGIFVLSDEEKRKIKWNDDEIKIIKPYYTTLEINRYSANKRNQYWVIYSSAAINKAIANYPNIKRHFDKYRNVITSVNKPYGLHRTREEEIFLGDKILSIRKCVRPSFAIVNFPCYVSRAFLIIKTPRINLKYLLAVLNSSLISFWLYYRGKLQGNQYQIDKIPLKGIPIVLPSKKIDEAISRLIDSIALGDGIKQIDKYDKQVDQYIYKLYGLTVDEIKMIENTRNERRLSK